MKIKDVFDRVLKQNNNATYADHTQLCESLDLYIDPHYDKVQEGIDVYFLSSWYCTDTYVGTRVYFLKGKPLAISHQKYRKSSQEFQFVSQEMVKELIDFLMSCCDQGDASYSTLDMEDDFDDYFSVDFYDKIMSLTHSNGAFYQNKEVTIMADGDPKSVVSQKALIKYKKTGKTEVVPVNEIKFKILTKEV